jgi:nuclear pore complex protein Nup205
MEQTRAFLAENRQSMVGIFKRFAKIGGVGTADHHGALSDLAKCYMTLISATNFLEYEDEEVKEQTRPTLFS